MAISVLVEALLPGGGGATASGGEPPPKDEKGLKEWIRSKLNPISNGLFCLVVALGGCFPPPLHNSFVFKVRLLKFCTELL